MSAERKRRLQPLIGRRAKITFRESNYYGRIGTIAAETTLGDWWIEFSNGVQGVYRTKMFLVLPKNTKPTEVQKLP